MLHTRTIARGIRRLSLTLILVFTAGVSVWAQTETSSPAREKNEAEPAGKTSSHSLDQTTAKTPSTTAQQDTQTDKPKKPKRGELIIAPRPRLTIKKKN